MKIDKEIFRAMVLIELASKEAINSKEWLIFSSLNLFKIFKQEFHLSNSVFYSILKLLNAFEVLNTAIGEKILNKLKWNYFIKKFPNEYSEALIEVERMENLKKGGINEKL